MCHSNENDNDLQRYNVEWVHEREITLEAESQRLTRLAATLGLCQENDTNLLKVCLNSMIDSKAGFRVE